MQIRWGWMALMCAAAQAAAAPVAELKPDQLAVYVAGHEYVVVQLTSPDPGCGYCKGADKIFDQAAAAPHRPALAYVRVQWSPWRQIPDFGKLMPVYGVPMQYVFKQGKLLGDVSGRPAGAQDFLAKVDEVIADPPANRAAVEPAAATPEAPSAPLSDAEQGALRQMIRRDSLKLVTGMCASRYTEHAKMYQDALQAWSGARQAGLKQAATLMLARTSGADAAAMGKLVDAEQKAMQAWHTDKLGLSMQKAPTMADCDKIAAGLKDLP
ncbi:thioredoxin family protein [Duganella rhizosphaerae]|uniref:thioredoxin family protein n=1 Tax=Duganella rhizosphaerae TaxID=2885763 RepID=UPI00403F6839